MFRLTILVPQKAESPIVVTVFGMVTLVSDEKFLHRFTPSEVTPV